MPLMVSENGRQKRIVPDWSVAAYLSRGWTGDDQAPSPDDRKATWVEYAEDHGIDTDGLTKSQIISAVEGS